WRWTCAGSHTGLRIGHQQQSFGALKDFQFNRMNATTKMILAGLTVIVLIAIGVMIKMIWFPTIKDAWFQTNGRQLRLSPAELVVVRPTHFPRYPANSIGYAAVDGIPRAAG